MLRHGEANPLSVAGLRKTKTCPPHFARVELPTSYYDEGLKKIFDWIYENLEGRFCYGQTEHLTSFIGFEIHSEASYFALMQDQIIPSDNGLF
jgi:hypothetical protein